MPRLLKNSSIIASALSDSIFEADFNSSLTPSVGAAGTFSRDNTEYYANSLTTYTQASSGGACRPAFPFRGAGTKGGLFFGGPRRGELLQSNVLSNAAWTTVGSLSVKSSIGGAYAAPNGANSTQILSSAVNSGVSQVTGIVAANNTVIFSVRVRGTFGSTACKLIVSGTGGTPESSQVSFTTSTTNWNTYQIAKTFTGAATGNVQVQLTVDANGGNICAGMAMLEVSLESGAVGSFCSGRTGGASAYIDTTTSTVELNNGDLLEFPSSTINPSAGGFCAWVNPLYIAGEASIGAIVSMGGQDLALTLEGSDLIFYYGGSSLQNALTSWTRGVWQHFGCSWDSLLGSLKIFQNGTLLNSSTSALTSPSENSMFLGSMGALSASDEFLDGIMNDCIVKRSQPSDSYFSTIYNSQKSNYGL